MEEALARIRKLAKLRKDIPQYFLCDFIMPLTVISVREHIEALKARQPDQKEVDIIIQSPGGLADDAYRIIRAFRKNFEKVNIVVPFWAKSAATLISVGGTDIIMDEFGEFGPLDAQIGKVREDSPELDRESALNDEHSINRIEVRFKEMYEAMYIRIYEHKKINIHKSELSSQLLDNLAKFYKPLLSRIDPYKLGEKRRKLDIGAHYARRIMTQFGNCEPSKMRLLVDYLVNGCPDHGYVIDYDVMRGFLDNVHLGTKFGESYAKALRDLSMELMRLEVNMSAADYKYLGFVLPEEMPNTTGTNGTNKKSKKALHQLVANSKAHVTANSNGTRQAVKEGV